MKKVVLFSGIAAMLMSLAVGCQKDTAETEPAIVESQATVSQQATADEDGVGLLAREIHQEPSRGPHEGDGAEDRQAGFCRCRESNWR